MDRRQFITFSTISSLTASIGGRSLGNEAGLSCKLLIDTSIRYAAYVEIFAFLISNEEKYRIFFPLTWGLRGFQLSITDNTGRESVSAVNTFHPLPPEMLNDNENFFVTYRNLIIGDRLRILTKDVFPNIGLYTVNVSYLSPVPKAYTNVSRAVVQEDGRFLAPPVRVNVK